MYGVQYQQQPQQQMYPQQQQFGAIPQQQQIVMLAPPVPVNTDKTSCSVKTSKIFIFLGVFIGTLELLNSIQSGQKSIELFIVALNLAVYCLGFYGFYFKKTQYTKVFCYGYLALSVIKIGYYYLNVDEFAEKQFEEMKQNEDIHSHREGYDEDDQDNEGFKDRSNNNSDQDYDGELTLEMVSASMKIGYIFLLALYMAFLFLFWNGHKSMIKVEQQVEEFRQKNIQYQQQISQIQQNQIAAGAPVGIPVNMPQNVQNADYMIENNQQQQN